MTRLLATALLFLSPVCFAAGGPNFVLIVADDLGYGDPGCYGSKTNNTPNIDALASTGLRFTDFHSGGAMCSPTRASILTGCYPQRFGKIFDGALSGTKQRHLGLPLEAVTIAERLQKAGYATGCFGKWHLGYQAPFLPTRQGFDVFRGLVSGDGDFHTQIDRSGNEDWWNHETIEMEKGYTTEMLTRHSLDFIEANHDKPFFLYLPYTVPHAQFEIPDLDPYENKGWPKQAKVYAAMITRMDDHIGKIMALLKELLIDKKTIVFFCSDNGAANRYDGLFDSSGPLRGAKRAMYEGGLRTPMIARWPGRIPVNTTSEAIWSFADFLPTVAALARAKAPKGLDGISVLPELLGQAQQGNDRFLYWEFFERGFQQAARWGNWKVVRPKKEAGLELYNLAKDIGEKKDVADLNPEIVSIFERFLKTARTESKDWPIK